MRQEPRKILARVFVALLIFLIGVVIYKQGNPYAYPGLENRILFVLVPSGIVLLYLYLEERETRNRLFSVIMVTIGRLHESKFMRFCEGIWERSPSLIRTRVSKVLAVLYTYLHKMSGYMLKQDPKQVVSYAFLGMLLIVALQSIFPQPSLEWARTYLMIVAVALGAITFYLNRDKLDEIEDDTRQEEIEGNRREMEFAGKYPRINRVWGVRWIVKWMYKEGWWYSVFLFVVLAISISFIVHVDLGGFLTVDEPRWINTGSSIPSVPGSYEEAMSFTFIQKSYARSEGYWDAYLSGNFGATFNNANPSATVNFLHFPAYMLKDHISFNAYLTAARLMIIMNNIFMLLVIYFIIKKLYSKKQALIGLTFIALLPQFVGFSRIISHDSFQGLYIIIFILYLWSALKYNQKKDYIITGIFFSLAILTQYKSEFLVPLLFLMPVMYYYIYGDINIANKFITKLPHLYFATIFTSLIILPAVLIYPQIIFERFFFYSRTPILLATCLSIFIFTSFAVKPKFNVGIRSNLKKFEHIFVRITVLLLSGIFFYSLLNISQRNMDLFYMQIDDTYLYALSASFEMLFSSIPTIFFPIYFIWLIAYFYKPRIDFSFILIVIFFALFMLMIFASYKVTNNGGEYTILGSRYIFVLIPLLLVGFASSKLFDQISFKKMVIILLIIITSLSFSNLSFSPFELNYNNLLVPEGELLTRTTWAMDTLVTSEYLNQNYHNVTVYNPRGRLEFLVNDDIKVLPWHIKFWEYNPDYIIIEWEKDHMFTEIFDYYRDNKEPIWVYRINGAIYTGIYKFDSNINYEELLSNANQN